MYKNIFQGKVGKTTEFALFLLRYAHIGDGKMRRTLQPIAKPVSAWQKAKAGVSFVAQQRNAPTTLATLATIKVKTFEDLSLRAFKSQDVRSKFGTKKLQKILYQNATRTSG